MMRSTVVILLLVALTVSGCGSGGGGGSSPAMAYPVYVTVSGLSGSGLVIQNNFSDSLPVTAAGQVAFAKPVVSGTSYNVSVLTQPSNPVQLCTVTGGTGTVNNAAVNGPTVTCVTQVPKTLYSLNYGDGTLSLYTIDAATGQPRARGELNVGSSPIDITGDGLGRFVYVLSSGESSIFGIDVSSSQPIAGGPVPTGPFPASLTAHPSGKWLYAVNSAIGDISGYVIDQTTGALTPMPGSPFKAGKGPRKLTVDAAGRFAYVTNAVSNDIHAYSIDPSTGALAPLVSEVALAGTQPSELVLHRNGKFAYVANTASPSISGYLVSDSGLGPMPQSPFATGALPGETNAFNVGRTPLLLHPNGKLLFMRSRAAKTISVFTIDPTTGALTAAAGSPHSVGDGAVMQALDPTGRWLFVANQGNVPGPGSISVFAVEPDSGAMTEVSGSPFALPGGPAWVSPDPSGQFLYAAASNDVVYSMRVDAVTGALTPLVSGPAVLTGDYPIVAWAVAGVVQPGPASFKSKFAYVPSSDDTITGYEIDSTSGALAPIPSSPFPSNGTGLSSLALSPAGKFAYSANLGSDNLTIFNVDGTTGALTPASNFAGATDRPHQILVDAASQSVYVAIFYGVAAYQLDSATGNLSGNIGAGNSSGVMALDGCNRFAFAISNGTVETYATNIGPGSIAYRYDTPAVVGMNAASLAVHPSGLFVYVANADPSGTIQSFVVTSSGSDAGTLTPLGAPIPAGSAPASIVVDPIGLHLYVANSGSNNISGYSIDPTSGVLSPFAQSPTSTGTHPIALGIDQSGRFLYAISDGDKAVWTYVIDPKSGALSPDGGPVATGSSSPTGIVLSNNTGF